MKPNHHRIFHDELTAAEYAEQLISAYRLDDMATDPEWDRAHRLAWVTNETILHIRRCTGVDIRDINRDAVPAIVESKLTK